MNKTLATLLGIGFLPLIALAQSPTFDQDLRFGFMNSAAVSELQGFLSEQGIYNGPITGNFLNLTLQAVKEFQRVHNIIDPPTGAWGPLSRARANEILKGASATTPPAPVPAPAGGSRFDQNLRYGMENSSEVTRLQEFLAEQGIYNGPITGNFFNLTLEAVKKFQELYGLADPPTGFWGSLSRGKANQILSGGAGGEIGGVVPGSSTAYQFVQNLAPGSQNSADVKKLQELLSDLGFYAGPNDGNFSPETAEALGQFQEIRQIAITKVFDTVTRSEANQVLREVEAETTALTAEVLDTQTAELQASADREEQAINEALDAFSQGLNLDSLTIESLSDVQNSANQGIEDLLNIGL